jgi:type I restriction enzyme M protein
MGVVAPYPADDQPLSSERHPLRRGIWAAANLLRAGGLSSLDTIEHLSLLLFLRLLAERDHGALSEVRKLSERIAIGDPLAESSAARNAAAAFRNEAFPRVRRAVERMPPQDPLHCLVDGFQLKIDDDRLFRQIVHLLSSASFDPARTDVYGDMYEQLIATLSEAGHLGQYFTPRHIVDAMVELIDPQPGESVYDPAAGSGGFLLGAARRELERGTTPDALCLHGRELNRMVRRLCVMNLVVHGLSAKGVEGGDALAPENQVQSRFDIVLTNPPFRGVVAADPSGSLFPVPTRSSEGLFVQHALAALRPGGRAAIVCPEGLLANLGSERALRRHLAQEASIDAVVSLPGGVFNPYTAVRTGILLLRKDGPTTRSWFFDVRHDGYDLDARRRPNGKSDLPAAVKDFSVRSSGPQAVDVPVERLADNDYRLVASRYLQSARRGSPGLRTLGEIASIRNRTIRPADAPDEAFRYVALEHIEAGTGCLNEGPPTCGSDIKSAKNRFAPDNVLYGKLRPYLAKVVHVDFEGICSTELLVLEVTSPDVLPRFLAEVLRSHAVTAEATALMTGANHPRIHPQDLLGLCIPVPSLAKQRRIVEAIARKRVAIARKQTAIARDREQLAALLEACWD